MFLYKKLASKIWNVHVSCTSVTGISMTGFGFVSLSVCKYKFLRPAAAIWDGLINMHIRTVYTNRHNTAIDTISNTTTTATTITTTMSSSFQLELQRSSTVLCLACRYAFPPAVVLCPSLKCRWTRMKVPVGRPLPLLPLAPSWKQLLLGVWHNDLPASAFLFVSWYQTYQIKQ